MTIEFDHAYDTMLVRLDPTAFEDLATINRERCNHFEGGPPGFTLGDYGCALAGEAGELCNVLKKLRRVELGIKMQQPPNYELLRKAKEEIADVYLYLDLICTKLGINLVDAIVAKFNADSDKQDAPYKLERGEPKCD